MKNEKFDAELLKKLTDHTLKATGLPKELITHYEPADSWSLVGDPTAEILGEKVNQQFQKLMGDGINHQPLGGHKATYDLRDIPKDVLLSAAFASVSTEAIVRQLFNSLNKVPTSQAIYRTLEFIQGTAKDAKFFYAGLSDEPIVQELDDGSLLDEKLRAERQMLDVLKSIKELPMVARTSIIMNDFPETMTISIKMFDSQNDDETDNTVEIIDSMISSNKPKGLVELEVLITNKVVY